MPSIQLPTAGLDRRELLRVGALSILGCAGGDAFEHVRQQGFGIELGGLAAGADHAVAAAAGVHGDTGLINELQ
jgi:hypothetical protein